MVFLKALVPLISGKRAYSCAAFAKPCLSACIDRWVLVIVVECQSLGSTAVSITNSVSSCVS